MPLSSDATALQSDAFFREVAEVSRPVSAGSGPADAIPDTIKVELPNDPDAPARTSASRADDTPFEIDRARARRIADMTSDSEYAVLQNQHRALTRKSFESGLTKNEGLQLQLIHWQLDCVDTARLGVQLDTLEQIARSQEAIAESITQAAKDFSNALATQSRNSRAKQYA